MKLKTLFVFLLINNISCAVSYRLTHPLYNPGFFSVFNTVLGALDFYEQSEDCEGLILDFANEGLFYDQEHGSNWWEYHFMPVSIGRKTSPNYKRIVLGLTNLFEMPTSRAHELIEKYVRIKPETVDKINNFSKQNFNNNYIIGVLYNKPQYGFLQPDIAYDVVLDCIEQKIQQAPENYKLLLATREKEFFDCVRKKFSSVICYKEPMNEKMSLYEEEETDLIECILLSKSNTVIGTPCESLKAVSQFNPKVVVQELDTLWLEKK